MMKMRMRMGSRRSGATGCRVHSDPVQTDRSAGRTKAASIERLAGHRPGVLTTVLPAARCLLLLFSKGLPLGCGKLTAGNRRAMGVPRPALDLRAVASAGVPTNSRHY